MKRVELIRKIYASGFYRVIRIVNSAAVLLVAAAFISAAAGLLFSSDYAGLFYMALSLGVPFVIVTLFRHFIALPRPMDLYDFGVAVKKQSGSFPSRHAYSAFSIGA